MGIDIDLEGSTVLVGRVLLATRMTRGFPVKRFYQKVGSRFEVGR